MKVDISFDDCNVSDIRAARLLNKYGFKGTFYFSSVEVPKTTQLSLKEIRDSIVLEYGHEIGGHTVSHPSDMKLLSDEDLKFEIENNKALIEGTLMKRPITKFCYPRGRHDERVRKAVKDAGYTEARTTRVMCIKNKTSDPFQTPTTIHMFPREEYEGVDWFELAVSHFNDALWVEGRGVKDIFFSLWGHTTELDRFDYWEKFETLLKYMNEKLSTVGANATNVI